MISDTQAQSDGECIRRAQKRLLRAQKKMGSWRKVEVQIGVNHGYMVALVKHGKVPSNPDLRRKLGLPHRLPSERPPRARNLAPLQPHQKWWRRLPASDRDRMIQNLFELEGSK